MPRTPTHVAVAALLTAALLAGCGDDPAPPAAPGTPPPTGSPAPAPAPARALTAADLKAHFEKMVEVGLSEDRKAAEALARSMVPSRAELRSVLRAGPGTEAFLKAYEGPVLETLPPPDPLASVKKGGTHSVIRVHAATTEELAAYAKGTTAYSEFPGAMKRFAQTVAAPGRTWYAVETLEPGKESGIRYTCLTAVGDRFVLVVKPWRALPEEAQSKPELPDTPK